ncbi:general secretion pathway protein GspB [Pseudoalteromonas sp. ZZD1]|uniref:general secretion pathway protein GspB n=1 Tax=Pseudoalteromonas sp. ZZD1 TaxID=3139395 RepID=UPI003BAA512E
MSYLLDALKQSEHHDEASAYDQSAQQLKQQQELKRYRFIALSLGVVLALGLTLVAGFMIGKWLQTDTIQFNDAQVAEVAEPKQQEEAKPKVEQVTASVVEKPVQESTTPSQTGGASLLNQSAAHVMPQGSLQPAQQYQWVQVPVNSVPTYPQNQPVLIQTPNGYQQVYNAPAPQYQAMVNQQPQLAQQAANTSSSNVDLSKYKVLGKPIGEPNTVKKPATVSDDELDSVPSELKNAFARAIKDTEQTPTHQVTQGTKNSSYAQPVELLPDGLLAILPSIKYQAHIYSSSVEKRWIKLNNRELYEGDRFGDFEVLEITPEQSVLSFDGYEFSLKALQDWPE